MSGAGALPAACSAGPVAAASQGRAIAVPGLEALNTGDNTDISSVSCASRGNCVAGGDYENMPRGATCGRTGGCTAGGTYAASDHVGRRAVQGFVT